MPPTKSPGPASVSMRTLVGYIDHDVSSKKTRSPNWSLGSKPIIRIENKSPGPATESVYKSTKFEDKFTRNGRVFQQASALHGQTKELRLDYNPGPAAHNTIDPTVYRWPVAPKFTAGGKLKIWNSDVGPGPNAEPTSLDIFKVKAPKYSLGVKTKELSLDKGPGSNTYDTIKPKLKTMKVFPEYSLHMKTMDPLQDKDKKPGPNKYGLSTHNPFDKGPSFSMRRRHTEYSHCPIVPGDNC